MLLLLMLSPWGSAVTHSCTLNPTVGNTFSGHAEFELLLEAVSHDKGGLKQE